MRLASFVPSAAQLSQPNPAFDHGDRMPTPLLPTDPAPHAQPEESSPKLTIEEFVNLARMSGAL